MRITADSKCVECGRRIVVRNVTCAINRRLMTKEHGFACPEMRRVLEEFWTTAVVQS